MNLLAKYKNKIIEEGVQIDNFMDLLMKQRNRNGKWTHEDRLKLREQIKLISVSAPFLTIFIIPGGFVILPLLAEFLDRRKEFRYS